MHSYCCHQLSYPYIRQLDRLFWTFAITLPSLALADSDPQATFIMAVFGTRVPLMNYRANCHLSVKLQTPNSKLQASNSKRQASNSKLRASNSKHEAVPFSASVPRRYAEYEYKYTVVQFPLCMYHMLFYVKTRHG